MLQEGLKVEVKNGASLKVHGFNWITGVQGRKPQILNEVLHSHMLNPTEEDKWRRKMRPNGKWDHRNLITTPNLEQHILCLCSFVENHFPWACEEPSSPGPTHPMRARTLVELSTLGPPSEINELGIFVVIADEKHVVWLDVAVNIT
ncbi:NAD(P)H-quinone oxidoreductase subunit 2 B [Striga asiatica]|uniref:NAD(P)H-quinone oxidoreductase subunit 2 B n=1 Tax=Striga asiatica TaxID=4170 RepID=A0A5A7P958_STRAF|nr:NAD(P)H-quinone oxidoreductase subunit 2 B [Striga asiatica]